MRKRILPSAAAALVLAWGAAPAAGQPADATGSIDFSGMYEVKGMTVVRATGERRAIKGTIILAQEGNTYTSTFSLTTLFPFVEATMEADVIGTGEGKVDGRTLSGIAKTQIVMSTVPGIDPGFAFVPRTVGPRLVSANVGRLEDDGSITIEIENAPAPGETYVPTHTTLRGVRISKTPSVDGPPDAEAEEPIEAPQSAP
ncbi:MAG: hypothetical protein JSU66_02175 [Deltaproteobacteria bacterium]|nr:MAG: hypothetical protein JSU66_02175 [Deltaproteobacteria bacterium]